MSRRTRDCGTRNDTLSPSALADWINADGELLASLVTLRRLGSEGAEAVEAVSAIRRVMRLRLSWELWAALVEGDGGDAEDLLLRALPLDVIEAARLALWGPSWAEAPA